MPPRRRPRPSGQALCARNSTRFFLEEPEPILLTGIVLATGRHPPSPARGRPSRGATGGETSVAPLLLRVGVRRSAVRRALAKNPLRRLPRPGKHGRHGSEPQSGRSRRVTSRGPGAETALPAVARHRRLIGPREPGNLFGRRGPDLGRRFGTRWSCPSRAGAPSWSGTSPGRVRTWSGTSPGRVAGRIG
jgi:hypothetical protein